MGVESIKEFREVELDIDTDASTTAYFLTESPGLSMTQRDSFTFNTEATTTGRRPVNFRLTGTVRGKLAKLRLTASGVVRLFGAKVLMRYLGGKSSEWEWAELPVEVTEPTYSQAQLPIDPTSNEYTQSPLPIDLTPDEYSQVQLPIDPTPDEYSLYALPFPETPLEPIWVNIPVDEIA